MPGVWSALHGSPTSTYSPLSPIEQVGDDVLAGGAFGGQGGGDPSQLVGHPPLVAARSDPHLVGGRRGVAPIEPGRDVGELSCCLVWVASTAATAGSWFSVAACRQAARIAASSLLRSRSEVLAPLLFPRSTSSRRASLPIRSSVGLARMGDFGGV